MREVRRFVWRVGGPVVIGLVAVPAVPVGQAVIVVGVALCALQAGVRARQREAGAGVVEGRAGPVRDRGTVTQRAILREACRLMRRIRRPVEIVQMAVDAGGAAQCVIVVQVARRALLGGMQSHQSEPGG